MMVIKIIIIVMEEPWFPRDSNRTQIIFFSKLTFYSLSYAVSTLAILVSLKIFTDMYLF